MKRNTRCRAGLILIGLTALTAGCSNREIGFSPRASAPAAMEREAASDAAGTTVAANAQKSAPAEDSPKLTLAKYQQSEPDRYLIKNAAITVETPDVRNGAKQLIELAKSVQGYVSDSHESVDGIGSRSITMTARVPSQQFDSMTLRIEAFGKVQDKQVTAEDVTEEFVDTDARARNLKKSEERLLTHLSHTSKLSDTLAIENELTRVRAEIEKSEGRLRFLGHRIQYSTFNVTFHETAHAQSVTPPETFSSAKIATDAGRGLIGFLQGVWALAIWLGIWSIVWLPPVALVVWYLRREIRRNRRPVMPPPSSPYDTRS